MASLVSDTSIAARIEITKRNDEINPVRAFNNRVKGSGFDGEFEHTYIQGRGRFKSCIVLTKKIAGADDAAGLERMARITEDLNGPIRIFMPEPCEGQRTKKEANKDVVLYFLGVLRDAHASDLSTRSDKDVRDGEPTVSLLRVFKTNFLQSLHKENEKQAKHAARQRIVPIFAGEIDDDEGEPCGNREALFEEDDDPDDDGMDGN